MYNTVNIIQVWSYVLATRLLTSGERNYYQTIIIDNKEKDKKKKYKIVFMY